MKRLHAQQAELLLVLQRPNIPLHTNGSENDIRGHVKWRKISGGTRRDRGRRCRDAFASLKKTCRKLGISCWDDLHDRIGQVGATGRQVGPVTGERPSVRFAHLTCRWRDSPRGQLLAAKRRSRPTIRTCERRCDPASAGFSFGATGGGKVR
jgi:hypothetical protein